LGLVEVADLLEQARDLGRDGVIDADRDPAAAARRDEVRRLLDRLRPVRHAGAPGDAPRAGASTTM
jgi:hypothetical protein